MKESTIQAKILKHLQAEGAWVYKNISTNRSGIPDIGGIYKTKPIYIEVKTGKGKLSALQEHVIGRIKQAGGLVIVAYGYEDFVAKLKKIEANF